ncbi:DUF2970 domain-containing protein [Kineobactrum salinum]|uniref:DUF2970 domain-containing protein n=1 Tax=Kineobactrum salinum TaxID=2708301 RepID=A0A6C0U4M0_9GAMM|nr:DUF2970 domain-containing protein [Kineobactrum salinum]QIB65937.1 DUF2970 domain-containing protein [Kineobactrum salinum]
MDENTSPPTGSPQAPVQPPERAPHSVRELIAIVLAGHLGVRKRVQRHSDFNRGNGLQVFVAAACYFALVVAGLVLLVLVVTA